MNFIVAAVAAAVVIAVGVVERRGFESLSSFYKGWTRRELSMNREIWWTNAAAAAAARDEKETVKAW